MTPYAFIKLNTDGINAIEKLKLVIEKDGKNPSLYAFEQFDHLPAFLVDSFSIGFLESAARINTGVLVTVARRLTTLVDAAIERERFLEEEQINIRKRAKL